MAGSGANLLMPVNPNDTRWMTFGPFAAAGLASGNHRVGPGPFPIPIVISHIMFDMAVKPSGACTLQFFRNLRGVTPAGAVTAALDITNSLNLNALTINVVNSFTISTDENILQAGESITAAIGTSTALVGLRLHFGWRPWVR